MSLSSEMNTAVHSLASAASARRQTLDRIRDDTGRHLADASASRHWSATAQPAQRSEALRSIRLATAMVLGAANKMIDDVRRQRAAQTAELKPMLADGAKRRRILTRKWLSLESATRKTLAVKNRRERLAYQKALRNDVAAMGKHNRAFLASLTKDRRAAAGIWHSHAAGGVGAASVRREVTEAAKREAEAMAKREAEAMAKREAEAMAKREAEAMAKREAEAMAKREAEAMAKREAEAKAKREAASSVISGNKGPA